MRSVATYRDILRKKGWRICAVETMKAVCPLWWTRNRAAIEQIQTERAYRYLKRRYRDVYMRTVDETYTTESTRIIWVCWLQGRDEAPAIVKRCIESIERWATGYEVRLITGENLLDYVTLPDYLVTRYREGRIPFAHFSDVLRTCLLYEHGGIWMDATVLLTGALPEYVTEEPLFMYRISPLVSLRHMGSNWMLAARKHHPIMAMQRELMFAYWQRESGLIDYYIYHILLYIQVHENPVCKRLFDEMPYVANVHPHVMCYYFSAPYSDKLWQHITSLATIHKLSYKVNIPNPGHTIYQYIINGNHEA